MFCLFLIGLVSSALNSEAASEPLAPEEPERITAVDIHIMENCTGIKKCLTVLDAQVFNFSDLDYATNIDFYINTDVTPEDMFVLNNLKNGVNVSFHSGVKGEEETANETYHLTFAANDQEYSYLSFSHLNLEFSNKFGEIINCMQLTLDGVTLAQDSCEKVTLIEGAKYDGDEKYRNCFFITINGSDITGDEDINQTNSTDIFESDFIFDNETKGFDNETDFDNESYVPQPPVVQSSIDRTETPNPPVVVPTPATETPNEPVVTPTHADDTPTPVIIPPIVKESETSEPTKEQTQVKTPVPDTATVNKPTKEISPTKEIKTPTPVIKPTKTPEPLPPFEGTFFVISSKCSEQPSYMTCIPKSDISKIDFSAAKKDIVLTITEDLSAEEVFNFASAKDDSNVQLINPKYKYEEKDDSRRLRDDDKRKLTFAITNKKFDKLVFVGLNLDFKVTDTNVINCSHLHMNDVDLDDKYCRTVLLPKGAKYTGEDDYENCFISDIIDELPDTTLKINVKSDCTSTQRKLKDDDDEIVICVLPADVAAFNFSAIEKSIDDIEITLYTNLDNTQLFNFALLTQTVDIDVKGEGSSPVDFYLDIAKVGSNIDELEFDNVALKFITSESNFNLVCNEFSLDESVTLDDSSKNVDISSIKKLDFGKYAFYSAFKKISEDLESISVVVDDADEIIISQNKVNISGQIFGENAKEIVIKTSNKNINIDVDGIAGKKVTIQPTADDAVVTVQQGAANAPNFEFGINLVGGKSIGIDYPSSTIPLSITGSGKVKLNPQGDLKNLVITKPIKVTDLTFNIPAGVELINTNVIELDGKKPEIKDCPTNNF